MLSLIIPVYKNEASLPELLDELSKLHVKMAQKLEVIFVVDGSPDRSHAYLALTLPQQPFASRLLLLSRNFGSFSAIRAGLEAGSGERFAVMAADLQEPPSIVAEMDAVLMNGPFDVAVGVREGREDPFFSRLFSAVFWQVYRRLVQPELPEGGCDIFSCTRAVRDQLVVLSEQRSSLIAQLFWLGFRRVEVPYHRQQRRHGKSAWTLHKKVAYLSDSIFAFTDLPIRVLAWIGGLGAAFSGTFGLAVLVARLLGWIAVPGYAATVLIVIFFGALNLFGLGLVGSYAWRAYENTKGRPLHVVRLDQRFGPQ